jgi:shikimate kinase
MSALTPGQPSLPSAIARVFVTGFMGAGKTTVGRLLAERLGWDFADSDQRIEEQTGQTVASLFETRGEAAFRELEAEAVRASADKERLVMALGGGALERYETRGLLASLSDTVLIFLDAPLDVLVTRCQGQANAPVRPVLADRAGLEHRWTTRLPGYRQAHLTVSTANSSPDEVAEMIVREIAGRCRETGRSGPASAWGGRRTGVPA